MISLILSISAISCISIYNQKFSKIEIQRIYKIHLVENFKLILEDFYRQDFNSILKSIQFDLKKRIPENSKDIKISIDKESIEVRYKYILDNKENKEFLQELKKLEHKEVTNIKNMYQETIDKQLSKYYSDNKEILFKLENRNINDLNYTILNNQKEIFENNVVNLNLLEIIKLNLILMQSANTALSSKNDMNFTRFEILFTGGYKIINLFDTLKYENIKNRIIKLSDLIFILIIINLSLLSIIIYKITNKLKSVNSPK